MLSLDLDMSKVNRAKSPLLFPLESLETRLDKFSNGLDKFSNGLECLKTRLQPRSLKFLRIEDRESSFEYRASRNCQLTFEWYCKPCSGGFLLGSGTKYEYPML